MVTNRILRIDNLVVAIPDTLQGTGSNGEVTIDDALKFLLEYRKTVKAKEQCQYGNFEYFFADIPVGTDPEDPSSINPEALVGHVWRDENKVAAGVMMTAIRDERLGEDAPYRNIYNADEQQDYEEALRHYIEAQEQDAAEEADTKEIEAFIPSSDIQSSDLDKTLAKHHCRQCDNICDERCPDYPNREIQ